VQCLDDFVRRQDVQRIIARCRESKAVQGVTVRLNRWWLAAWRLGERLNPFDPKHGFEMARKVDERTVLEFIEQPWLPIRTPKIDDLEWRPEPYFLPYNPESPTVIITVCLYPDGLNADTIPRFEFSTDFSVVYEARPVAYLYASPRSYHRPLLGGISIGVNSSDYGTLGGILKGDNENWYGLTCGHVAATKDIVEQPAQADGGRKNAIGRVIYSEMPPAFPVNLEAISANQRAYAGQVDAALILIEKENVKQEILKIGKIDGIIGHESLAQLHRLETTGRTSDWKVLQYGSNTPYYNIKVRSTGDNHCFENPLFLRDPTGRRPVDEGDSGAWICVSGNAGCHWAGMIVGGDGQVGFAVSARALKSWWEDAPRNLKLSLS
jgi:hypothetical protein